MDWNSTHPDFNVNDNVQIAMNAPEHLRPGIFGWIISCWNVDNEESAQKYGVKIGDIVCCVEASDGKGDLFVPAEFILHVKS